MRACTKSSKILAKWIARRSKEDVQTGGLHECLIVVHEYGVARAHEGEEEEQIPDTDEEDSEEESDSSDEE